MTNNSIVNPAKRKKAPNIGEIAVMVSNGGDLKLLCRQMKINDENSSNLLYSKLYSAESFNPGFVLAGPIVGAPYAVLVLETLIAWGARKVLFLGWCGAISPKVKIGDIIIPTGSIIDEGTSPHYMDYGGRFSENQIRIARPSKNMVQKIKETAAKNDLGFHAGNIWSTDAPYRETPSKVKYFQGKDALGVEMETSALFTVGSFRNVEVGGILVVSDELSTYKWKTGFSDNRFKESRRAAHKIISRISV